MTEINFLLKVYLNDVSKPAVRLIRENHLKSLRLDLVIAK